jgi:uncharacterized membrane protein YkoI
MNRKLFSAAIAGALAIAIGSAYAAKSTEDDALAVSNAKIGLAQAIAAAEQHTGGKASRAEFERNKSGWVFDVEVVKDQKVTDVKVDPASGSVISATEDKADQDDERDEQD